ncbi:MAG: Kelch repeat-containing protein [Candidatus Heimdallarchaeaceae archaeon]|jgi:hypothetical protein
MKKNKHRKKLLIFSAILIITNLFYATINISADCAPNPYPSGKIGHSMVYDSVNDMIIVYGGYTDDYYLDRKYDTRAYDYNNNNWTNLNPAGNPYGSSWGAMAFDSESAKIIHFGGKPLNDYTSNETWVYDYTTNAWTKADPNEVPSGRSSHVMAYDSESDVVIMHGGGMWAEENPEGELIHCNDTWAYDFNTDTWTNMAPTGLDVGIAEAQMVYDSESDRIIMVGGYFVDPYDDPLVEYFATETWAYDYNTNTWENITTTIHPEHRYDHALAYDSESDRTILVGGWEVGDGGVLQDETWSFDYNTQTWENMNPSTKPKRLAHQMTYDEESDLVILFGGIKTPQPSAFYNKVYTYDYNSNNWTLMTSELCPDDTEYIFMLPIVSLFNILAVIVILRRSNRND